MTTLTDDFACEVLSVVAEIPEGRVVTYGQIRAACRQRKKRPTGCENPVAR